ncbi:unnamed protein product [Pocillopora meandrina]|uniref:Uncharacterized protein n=1 Tax=Pocillopora meandrina TaxID=46732 RepID=A0AAU9X4E6_9CNID|nr:unnamed protein product [Pocillopora meandrina]
MKTIILILSLSISLALGCSKLPELSVCNKPEGDCSCQDGLSCVLTKKVIEHGIETPVKQCMPGDVDIEVESIDLDNQAADAPMRIKRWLFFNRCLTEEDCSYNRCCAFNKRCVPKLKKFFTCVLTGIHKCGCADGLECKETAHITLPITGTKLSLRHICFALASAACENLKRLEACNNKGLDCSCQSGLSCRLTKQMIVDGKTVPVKQCMGDDEKINIETINVDPEEQNNAANAAYRVKRFLGIITKCQSDVDCAPNFCCPIVIQRCLPKIPEDGACNFKDLHRCGCMDGLVCQKTTEITIFPGIKIPLEQCVKM